MNARENLIDFERKINFSANIFQESESKKNEF